MNRWDVINTLIQKFGYKSYLEIGYFHGHCFNNINIKNKVAVDPFVSNRNVIKMKSEDYLKKCISTNKKFDIIFIDGNHCFEYVKTDYFLSKKCLNPGGAICFHDVNPPDIKHCRSYEEFKKDNMPWCGDCWLAFLIARLDCKDKISFSIKDDYGVGVIIDKPSDNIIDFELPDINMFIQNKDMYCNFIDISQI